MSKFVYGALAGAVLGAAVSMAVSPMSARKVRCLKRKVSRTLRAAGSIWDVVGDLRG